MYEILKYSRSVISECLAGFPVIISAFLFETPSFMKDEMQLLQSQGPLVHEAYFLTKVGVEPYMVLVILAFSMRLT